MFYDNFYKALVSYSLQITSSLSVSEDLVREVFSRLWEKENRLFPILVLKTYLYNSVRNLCGSYLRHKECGKRPIRRMSPLPKSIIWMQPVKRNFHRGGHRQLFAMIDQLPPRQREIFLMCMEGKKNKDIAAALEISVETGEDAKKARDKIPEKKISAIRLSCCSSYCHNVKKQKFFDYFVSICHLLYPKKRNRIKRWIMYKMNINPLIKARVFREVSLPTNSKN